MLAAAQLNDTVKLKKLLSEPNAHPDTFSGWFSPLHMACSHGNLESVIILLDHGANINLPDTFSQLTPFLLAARNSHHKVVRYLLTISTELVNERDKSGSTALHHACINADIEAVELLLPYYSDIDVLDINRHTPLHKCLQTRTPQRALPIITILVHAGSNMSLLDASNCSYLVYVLKSRNCSLDLFNCILERCPDNLYLLNSEGKSLLHYCLDPEITKFLLSTSLKDGINTMDRYGRSPIQSAIANSSFEVAKLLIENGAILHPEMEDYEPIIETDVQDTDAEPSQSGTDAMQYVTKYRVKNINTEITRPYTIPPTSILYNHFARTYSTDDKLTTLLLDNAKTPIASYTTGETLHFAVTRQGNVPYFEKLFEYFTFSEFRKLYDGKTILHVAIESGHHTLAFLIILNFPELLDVELNEKYPVDYIGNGKHTGYFGELLFLIARTMKRKDALWKLISSEGFEKHSGELFVYRSVEYLVFHHVRACKGDNKITSKIRQVRDKIIFLWAMKSTDNVGHVLIEDVQRVILRYL